MREAGDVCFADVQRDGEGVVEFLRREDMEYALRRLDRTEFRSHQVGPDPRVVYHHFLDHLRRNCHVFSPLPLCRVRRPTSVSMRTEVLPTGVAPDPALGPEAATRLLITGALPPCATSRPHAMLCPAIARPPGGTPHHTVHHPAITDKKVHHQPRKGFLNIFFSPFFTPKFLVYLVGHIIVVSC